MSDYFKDELEQLINKYSKESGSDTPDFILAEYLEGCLKVFNKTVKRREQWYGHEPEFATTELSCRLQSGASKLALWRPISRKRLWKNALLIL
jgi:hypothetical protein